MEYYRIIIVASFATLIIGVFTILFNKKKTGFKFVVPTGNYILKLTYSGCKNNGNDEKEPVVISHSIDIQEKMVTVLSFDGSKLYLGNIKESRAVTLEKIYESVKEIEKNLEK